MDRSYTPKERIHFYKFITARGEWDELRQIAKDLGWDKNRIRQFNRIRAYWENKPSQKRQGGSTAYMDELINEYFKRNKVDPTLIVFGQDDLPPDAEFRNNAGNTDRFKDIIEYCGESLLTEMDGVYTSNIAEIVINEDGTLDLAIVDSNPAQK